MTALEFQTSMNPDGTLNVPHEMAAQLKDIPSFRVLVLLPADSEDEAWDRVTESEFFRGYADSDSIYDDV
jgi:hypothetical protein